MTTFSDSILPIDPTTSKLVMDSKFIHGGFHIVELKSDLQLFDVTILKVGMFVAVNEELGKIYKCTHFSTNTDANGDSIAVDVVFEPLVIGSPVYTAADLRTRISTVLLFNFERVDQTIDMIYDMQCKSFVLTSLVVDRHRNMEVKIYGSAVTGDDPFPYRFLSDRKNIDDGSTYLKNYSRFQYRKFNIIANQNNPTNTQFTFSCRSFDPVTYHTALNTAMQSVKLRITYIPLEL